MLREPVQSLIGNFGDPDLPALAGGRIGPGPRQPVKDRALSRSRETCNADFHYLVRNLLEKRKSEVLQPTVQWRLLPAYGLQTTDFCMCDHWMPLVKLPLSIEQFRQLPRNAAYKYEYLDKHAYLSPRPRHYHALLELRPLTLPDDVRIEPINTIEPMSLAPLFAAAFGTIQPFGCLDDKTRLLAAREALARVLASGDGPFIEQASFVATEDKETIGAILITLLPDGDPCAYESYEWKAKPPPDCIARRLGRPHLTWVFVSPHGTGHGIGTALLAAAVNELQAMGFTQLLTTFMLGNESSMLWHWRNGFRLVSHPGSYRLMKERWKK